MRRAEVFGNLGDSISFIWRCKLIIFGPNLVEFLDQYADVEEQDVCEISCLKILYQFFFLIFYAFMYKSISKSSARELLKPGFDTKMSEVVKTTYFNLEQLSKRLCKDSYCYCSCKGTKKFARANLSISSTNIIR